MPAERSLTENEGTLSSSVNREGAVRQKGIKHGQDLVRHFNVHVQRHVSSPSVQQLQRAYGWADLPYSIHCVHYSHYYKPTSCSSALNKGIQEEKHRNSSTHS